MTTMILNSREVAQLCHLPGADDGRSEGERTGSRRLPPAPGQADRGVLVGYSDSDGREIRLPAELLRRHHFVCGHTGSGKSTLLLHMAAGVMDLMVAPSSGPMPLLVVIDPHGDFADALAERVPGPLRQHLDYVDASTPSGFAINLIDAHAIRDGDREIEQVIKILHRQWADSWGPRLEGALRLALRALYAANVQRDEHDQYSILDVTEFLVDLPFQGDVLRAAGDAITRRWEKFVEGASRAFQAEVRIPVTGKILQLESNNRAREIFGASRTTLSFRRAIASGGILIIKIPVGTLGEGSTELIGSALVNLLAQTVDEQLARPAADRRTVICVVDEATLLATTDYGRMLSGLRASGGALVMATQTLAQLDAADPALTETILGNVDALTVFGVGAADARRLQPELGDPVTVADTTDLDNFVAYARWRDGVRRGPVFSFRVRAPDEVRSRRTRAGSPQPVPEPHVRTSWPEMLLARGRALLGL